MATLEETPESVLTTAEYDQVSAKADEQAKAFTLEIINLIKECEPADRLTLTGRIIYDLLYRQYYSENYRAIIEPKRNMILTREIISQFFKENGR